MENITIGQIGVALGTIVAIISGVEFLANRNKKHIKEIIKEEITTIKTDMITLKDELNKNSLNTMKNTICNENIPLSERIIVGKEYLEKGGNGAVKIYYHKLEEEYEKKLAKEEKL